MSKAPVLALLDFSKPFVVETNASGSGWGLFFNKKTILLHSYLKHLVLQPAACQPMKRNYWPSLLLFPSGGIIWNKEFVL